jgi:3-oxoacyl-(acyl-carrier-protein) synthase
MNRVAITGLGIISPLGNTVAEVSHSLETAKSGIGPVTLVPRDTLAVKIAAEVKNFDPEALFPNKRLALLDRNAQLALAAANNAITQSGITFSGGLGAKTATIIGVGVGGMTTVDDSFDRLYAQAQRRLHPLTIPKLMISAAMSHITMEHGITGPSFTVASACASANHAIGVAFDMVRSGRVEAAITGGSEAVITMGTLKGWEALRIMSSEPCRPFSKGRNGMTLGEGAGIFVLESMDRAIARGADIWGEVIGFGMTSDATDIVLPSADGSSAAIAECLKDGRLNPDDVGYISAHGTGTVANDATETKAIKMAFGEAARKLQISSTKALHGHALGGSGAIELAATLIAMRDGFIPPTANYAAPDPDCDLDYVPNEARQGKFDVALSNSFAFGGHNAVLAVKRV